MKLEEEGGRHLGEEGRGRAGGGGSGDESGEVVGGVVYGCVEDRDGEGGPAVMAGKECSAEGLKLGEKEVVCSEAREEGHLVIFYHRPKLFFFTD